MPLLIHPNARDSFNSSAAKLLSQFSPPKPEHRPSKIQFEPNVPIAAVFTEKSIFDIETSVNDGRGVIVARYFYHPQQGQLGLYDDGLHEFNALVANIQRQPAVSAVVSATTVETLLFRWCRDRISAETTVTFWDYFAAAAQKMIVDCEIWLPVATLYVEEPFTLGRVLFQTITSDHIGRLTAHWEDTDSSRTKQAAAVEDLRRRVQGLAAATSTYRAESVRAEELAVEASEDSLGMLRLFSSEILHPHGWSGCSVEGLSAIGGNLRFVLGSDGSVSFTRSLPSGLGHQWRLSSDQLKEYFRLGLRDAHDLLRETNRTEFEEVLLSALRHYSISVLKKDPSEKLLYIVTALESLLLRGQEEGQVAQNFRERFAILRGSDTGFRTKILKRAREVYALRSRFVHGGIRAKDVGVLEEFMVDA